ncbi:ribonucleotide-diphosphate reductase subunit beta [Halosquirtibacter xylanolyticus]|uniref:class Ia ribonucleoside-diphosphate reductase subunit beta n=1 Tax=Halosquirtibacter xylanolyticus TaxID=3374599 RepID=UPI003749282C|nr:ribonucleotide-diphosphate reductase subunit beta [Prolixibacteraceae bacterium]
MEKNRIKCSLYDSESIDFTTTKMFFGEGRNLQRYDVQKYPYYDQITQRMMSYFWRPEEVSLLRDSSDFQKLTEHESFIFTENIKYQILLDSVQGRSPILTFGQVVTIPELEEAINVWGFFENIHSMSYSYIIKNLYDAPSEVFDEIMINEMIKVRAEDVTNYYNQFYESLALYHAESVDEGGLKVSDERLKRELYLALVSVNILEGIRFYVSFACSFSFAEHQKMEGNAKILKLIARDENEHLALTQRIIMDLREKEEEGFSDIVHSLDHEVYEMYRSAIAQEIEWAEHLFKGKTVIGLNKELLVQYMHYMADRRLHAIGLQPIYGETKNPLKWMKNWLRNDHVEVLPQETEISSYVVGGVDMNFKEVTFDFE